MTRVIARGRQRTSAERDYTIKIDAVALDPESTYYYRLRRAGALSPIGRTRTLADPGRPHLSGWRWRPAPTSVRVLQRLRPDRRTARPECGGPSGDYLYEYRRR